MRPTVAYHPSVPLHHQIQGVLRAKISAGEWEPEERIPTEIDLMGRFGVSRSTIREALRSLERDGLILRMRGRGTFVKRAENPLPSTVTNTLYGYEAEVRVLGTEDVPAPTHVMSFLGVPRGESVRRFLRLEIVENAPLAVLINYLPLWLASRLQLEDLQRYGMREVLNQRLGIPRGITMETIGARLPDEEIASLLGTDLTQPVLSVRLNVSDAAGKPIQVADTFYRVDRYEYRLEVLPDGSVVRPSARESRLPSSKAAPETRTRRGRGKPGRGSMRLPGD